MRLARFDDRVITSFCFPGDSAEMEWNSMRSAARHRYSGKHDSECAASYDQPQGVGFLTPESIAAGLADLSCVLELRAGDRVLDAGAGTGALSRLLARIPGLKLAALEPSLEMLNVLRQNRELAGVRTVEGHCDGPEDRQLFPDASFDWIGSRKVANGLFDPLGAFANWFHWLRPGGRLFVIDGLFGRSGWTGPWAEEVDILPLACCQSRAMIPYLLEKSGFRVEAVEWMSATNSLPGTRTPQYVVVASRLG